MLLMWDCLFVFLFFFLSFLRFFRSRMLSGSAAFPAVEEATAAGANEADMLEAGSLLRCFLKRLTPASMLTMGEMKFGKEGSGRMKVRDR
jgi:hypothetical protein